MSGPGALKLAVLLPSCHASKPALPPPAPREGGPCTVFPSWAISGTTSPQGCPAFLGGPALPSHKLGVPSMVATAWRAASQGDRAG